jgi:hypothetical protein
VVTDPTPPTDLRAIDVSVAYDDRKLRVVDQRSHMVHLRYPTRDIFEVTFEVIETGDPLVVIASHWPSRRQGKEHSEPSRMTVAENTPFWSGTMSASSRPSTWTSRQPGTWPRCRPGSRRRC